MRDEAEIRGHRRTYIGALPGRILHAIRQAGVKNPLIVLDEIDKLGQGVWGSPEAALLEVLDPEQNHTFTDNYLEIAFDLSEVMFVCTANSLEGVLQPLRDRLEVIEIDGYTQDEKLAIAKRHLLPKALKRHNLPEDALLLDDSAVASVIADYTREAGVRELERQLTKLCRRLAFDTVSKGAVAHGDGTVAVDGTTKLDGEALHAWLGKAKFFNEMAERTAVPGVAIGMAWTPVGGDILFVEASRMRGKGKLEITGQLGDVMQESARAALTHLRSKAGELGLDPMVFGETDVHIHVPAGAVPKDGPSAGITMFAALASIMLDRRVRSDTAMTGECTLRGRVLPVGGIKAKLLAAHRAGIKRVVLPKKNERDVDDVPKEIQDELTLVYVDAMQAVLDAVLEPAGTWTAARDTALPSGEPQHVAH
jgi:ATP-dependent Lon protease